MYFPVSASASPAAPDQTRRGRPFIHSRISKSNRRVGTVLDPRPSWRRKGELLRVHGGAETPISDDDDGTWTWTSVCTAGAADFLGFICGAGFASSHPNRYSKTKLPWNHQSIITCTAALCSAAQHPQSCLLNLSVCVCGRVWTHPRTESRRPIYLPKQPHHSYSKFQIHTFQKKNPYKPCT